MKAEILDRPEVQMMLRALGFSDGEQPTIEELQAKVADSMLLFRAPQFTPSIPAASRSRMVMGLYRTTDETTGEMDFDFEGPTLITGFLPVISEVAYNQFKAANERQPDVTDFLVRFERDRDDPIITQTGTDALAGAGQIAIDDFIDLAALNGSGSGSGRLWMLLLSRTTPNCKVQVRSKYASAGASGLPHNVQVSINAFFTPLYER